ncbi:uncharacterized protein LOC119228299 [Pungitius pungitius]|uniref:uncharacterized protein LOC119228299 n=1 Tax=Pungitius pungitius TaxID=134920 RepID=UPI002E0DE021
MNIFIIFTIPLGCILHRSHGFKVIQPQYRSVNPDGSASISCEHTANASSVEDVRLSALSVTNKASLLCQKGRTDCENIAMLRASPQKWLFILLNIGPEAMAVKYQCVFTVKKDNLDLTRTGTPTQLLPSQKEAACLNQPSPSSPPPSPPSLETFWIAIGLLALMFLYSCVITSFYIRLRCSKDEAGNSTYVEMRKAPRPRNPPL